jgi:hypothetical protein
LSLNLCALDRSRLKRACLHSFYLNSFHHGFISQRGTPKEEQKQKSNVCAFARSDAPSK